MRTILLMGVTGVTFSLGCMDYDLRWRMQEWETDSIGGPVASGVDVADGSVAPGAPPMPDATDTSPPALTGECAAEETEDAGACILSGRSAVLVTLHTDEPAALDVTDCPATCEALDEGYGQLHRLLVFGRALAAEPLTIRVFDVNGNDWSGDFALTGGGGPAVAIFSVLADPLGEEPLEEYVELVNFGEAPIDLSGYMVDDNHDRNGDVLPDGAVILPGESVLLAQAGYPATGTTVIPLASSIGTTGLKNSASESVQLYDGQGTLVSSFETALVPREGVPIVRVHPAMPDGVEGCWRYGN